MYSTIEKSYSSIPGRGVTVFPEKSKLSFAHLPPVMLELTCGLEGYLCATCSEPGKKVISSQERVANMEKLTPQQERVLQVIKEIIAETGYPPSVRELGKRLGLKSTATVHSHLATLERKGYIHKTAQKSRAFNLVQKEVTPPTVLVPLVGKVRAGMPILASENISEMLPFPKSLVKGENVFLLQVEGDSMIGAGIYANDYVLVRQQETAEDGDIVVALIEDEATVKRFFKEKDAVRLQPENPHMEPIISRDVRILGKVIGLYRTIH